MSVVIQILFFEFYCLTNWHIDLVLSILDNEAPGTASSYLMQSNYDMDIYGEAPDKMTYTEQANKRSHCKRLTWWVQTLGFWILVITFENIYFDKKHNNCI